jgi:hypothetical protein
MVGAQYVYSLRAMDMWRLRRSGDLPVARSALADGVCQRPVVIGAPHRGGGLLASKPELCADTHDRAHEGSDALGTLSNRRTDSRDLEDDARPTAARPHGPWGACDA